MNNTKTKTEDRDYTLEILLTRTQIMMLFRVAIVVLLLGYFFFSRYVLGIPYPALNFLAIAAIAVLYNTFFLVLERTIKFSSAFWPRLFSSIRVAMDMVLMSSIIYFSGGIFSPLVFFFLLPIFGFVLATGNLFLSLLMSLWALIAYSSIFILPYYKFIPPIKYVMSIHDNRLIIMRAILFSAALLIVTFLVHFVVRLLERRENEALNAKEDFEKIKDKISGKIKEMERISHFMEGREIEFTDLKNEANRLLSELNRPAGEH